MFGCRSVNTRLQKGISRPALLVIDNAGSDRDRDRLKALHEVPKGHITQRRAAEQLRLTLAKPLSRFPAHTDTVWNSNPFVGIARQA